MRIVYVVAVGLAITAVPRASAQVMYSVQDLGYFDGMPGNHPRAINASGQVTGYAQGFGASNRIGFRVAAGGQITDPGANLGTFGGSFTAGLGINASGQVTGSSDFAGNTVAHAFRTTGTGDLRTATDLGTLGGRSSVGTAINDRGQVVGSSDISGNLGASHAFRTAPGGVIDASTDLGTFGGTNSAAFGINATGQVTGRSDMPDGYGTMHVFRTTANGTLATAEDLGTLDGGQPGVYATGFAINSAGQVVGYSYLSPTSLDYHAFRSSPNGQPIVLQDLGGGSHSYATAINSLGVVVGQADGGAFIFDTQFHYLTDLVPAGWGIGAAWAINDAGQIACEGSFGGGQGHALLLTPIPEPGSLLLTGFAGLWLLRRRLP